MEESLKLKRASYNLWTFVTSKMISSFGAQVCTFAISFYILSVTGSATSFAALLICNIIPRTILAPFAGYIVDTFSKKKVVIIAQIAATLTLGILFLYSTIVGFEIWIFYVGTTILSVCGTFSGLAFTASISSLINKERLQQAMSLNQMAMSFSAIGAPVIGGWIYGFIDLTTFFLIYFIASFIALILESTMDFKLYSVLKGNKEKEKEKIWESIKLGFVYLKSKQVVMTIITVALFINFLFGSFEVGFSYVLIQELKISEEKFGLINGTFAFGMLVMSIILSKRKPFKYPLVISKIFIMSTAIYFTLIPLPLLITIPADFLIYYYMILMFIFGANMILVNMPIGVVMQTTIDEQFRGRVFSIMDTFGTALLPIGMILFGFLFDVVPAQIVFISIAILVVFSMSYLMRRSVVEKAYPNYYNKKLREVS